MREPAERAEAAVQIAWLAPDAASLAALARPSSSSTWTNLRHDPGAVLLVLRSVVTPHLRSPDTFDSPAILESAQQFLARPGPGFIDWGQRSVRSIYQTAITLARTAFRLAEYNGRPDPDRAWCCGLLAPLGWMALAAVDSGAVSFWLEDPQRANHADLARRLARRWQLPAWLSAVLDNLGLPSALAESFGADPDLFRITRWAVQHVREKGLDLGLAPDCDAEWATDRSTCEGNPEEPGEPPRTWRDPAQEPLLGDLLAAAAETRRLRGTSLHRCLEDDNAVLHRALEVQVQSEAERLQSSKLSALAEFGAGAGHEINNPLAVISGQAQYLLSHSEEWFADDTDGYARKSLQTIIAQTKRIHSVLRDLMQFARPSTPCPDWFDLPALLGEVASSLQEMAAARRVRLELPEQRNRLRLHADVEQVRQALVCLVRNAVEAAPPDGWARLSWEDVGPGRVAVFVEDSGAGPDAAQIAHLFDPFFSGRTAGRGRGLGLPIAWRLARLQGGDVRLETPRAGQPTRFVVNLPKPSLVEPAAIISPSLEASPLPSALTSNGCY